MQSMHFSPSSVVTISSDSSPQSSRAAISRSKVSISSDVLVVSICFIYDLRFNSSFSWEFAMLPDIGYELLSDRIDNFVITFKEQRNIFVTFREYVDQSERTLTYLLSEYPITVPEIPLRRSEASTPATISFITSASNGTIMTSIISSSRCFCNRILLSGFAIHSCDLSPQFIGGSTVAQRFRGRDNARTAVFEKFGFGISQLPLQFEAFGFIHNLSCF